MCENESWCQSTMMNEYDVYTKIKFIYFDDYENSSICFYILKENFSLFHVKQAYWFICLLYNQFIDYFGIISIGTPSWDFKAKREALFMSRMCNIGSSNFRISQFLVCAYLFSKSELSIKIFNQGPLLANVNS